MGVITGTVDAVSFIAGSAIGSRKSFIASCSFAAYSSSDSGALAGVVATLAAADRNGKTKVITSSTQGIGVTCIGAGVDTAGQAVYVGAVTVSSASVGTLAFNLTDATGSELTSATACKGVQLLITVDES